VSAALALESARVFGIRVRVDGDDLVLEAPEQPPETVLELLLRHKALLTNRPPTGRYRVLTAPRDWRFGMISRADVADFLVRQIDDRALIGTTPLLIN
jgi:hypothetical protein